MLQFLSHCAVCSFAPWPYLLKLLSSDFTYVEIAESLSKKGTAIAHFHCHCTPLAMHVHLRNSQGSNPGRNSEADSPVHHAGFTCLWTCGPTQTPHLQVPSFLSCFSLLLASFLLLP